MKKLFWLLALCAVVHVASAQTVTSTCSASDSVKALYRADAARLALRKIYSQKLADTINIKVPAAHVDTVLRALLAVYNATALAARTVVISQYSIHTFPNPNMNTLYVSADSSTTWMQNLQAGIIPTGNPQVDGLIAAYHLKKKGYLKFLAMNADHIVIFGSDSTYNIPPLAAAFEAINKVTYAEASSSIGDGNDIEATIFPTHVELDYSIGWGDCPAGCIYRHYWKFRVYYDCTVEFVGEFGSTIPPPPPTISVAGTLCTNQTLTVTISGASSYSLNNMPITAPQFTLSSATPTYYMVGANNGSTIIYQSIGILNCATSIREHKAQSLLTLYPNPAATVLNIAFSGSQMLTGIEELSIYNVLGQLVLRKDLKTSSENVQINISELPPGSYCLRAGNEVKQFVKE